MIPPELVSAFSIGDTATVSFIYDTDAADESPFDDGFWAISDYQISLDNDAASATAGELAFDGTTTTLRARTGSTSYDLSGLETIAILAAPQLHSAHLTGLFSTLSGDQLPQPEDFADFESEFHLTFNGPNGPTVRLDQSSVSATDLGGGLVRVEWTGEIGDTGPSSLIPPELDHQFSAGDVATVSFVYDTTAMDMEIGAGGTWLVSDYQLTVGSYTATAPGGELFTSGNDVFDIRTGATSYGLSGPDPASLPLVFELFSANLILEPWNTDELPAAGDFSSFDGAFGLTFDDASGPSIRFEQISIVANTLGPTSVPEPSSLGLFGLGLLGLGFFIRRNNWFLQTV